MRNIVLFVFCVLLPIRSKALPVDSLILNINRASDSLKRNYTEQNQRAFFSLFPSSARRLAFVEDYLSETDNKTYIYDWFETLGNLTAIDDSSYCDKLAQGGLSVAGGCRCLTKDGNTSIEKEGYIPYPLQA